MINLFILLLLWHFLADFPLQGDFLAANKNPYPPVNRNQVRDLEAIWPWCMGAHCAIHAGGVYVITGWWVLFVAELVAHAAIDCAKCSGRITFGQDQVLHLGCKVLWIVLLVLR
ncbi:MAG: hypothetical protein RLZZ200_526 [Pseudomonadota bacterium]|jgi:hypothetical protein